MRSAIKAAAVLVAVSLVACAPTKYQIKAGSSDMLAAAYEKWRDFDRQHALDLVESAKTRAEAEAAVNEWRKVQFQIDAAFLDARTALEFYSAAVDMNPRDAASILSTALAALAKLQAALAQYGIPVGDLLKGVG